MDKFKIAYKMTLGHEGGYVNDPDDRGGETYKGIARKFHPDWLGWQIIDKLKESFGIYEINKTLGNSLGLQAAVEDFYYKKFWLPANLDEFPPVIANEIFDTGVNQGLGTAVKYLQEALNLLNNTGKHFADITVDGGLGRMTLEAFNSYLETDRFQFRTRESNLKVLLKIMNGLQFQKYLRIVKSNPDQEKYFYGWVKRV